LEKAKFLKKPLFIIAKDLSKDVISALIFNHIKNIIDICAITIPGMGTFTSEILEDLSLITNAKLFSALSTKGLEEIEESDFGIICHLIMSKANQ